MWSNAFLLTIELVPARKAPIAGLAAIPVVATIFCIIVADLPLFWRCLSLFFVLSVARFVVATSVSHVVWPFGKPGLIVRPDGRQQRAELKRAWITDGMAGLLWRTSTGAWIPIWIFRRQISRDHWRRLRVRLQYPAKRAV
jgi:hypothetical protein